ncbi:hypothetical protein BKA70DRAFT_1343047 [Coprinopsis sp. MPI-PUGE-AT-0042]|nr:hypothetical protein BKA70DRAFT_1343047 [Coprinopsis sp. MPI-PUGE-AT-0042]
MRIAFVTTGCILLLCLVPCCLIPTITIADKVMDDASDGFPVSPTPPAIHYPPFKYVLLIPPFTTISFFLYFINMFSYWKQTPPHLCSLTNYCIELLSFPLPLSFLGALSFVPALLVLDHFLAVSPAFAASTQHVDYRNAQVESINDVEDESPIPSTGRSNYTRGILMSFIVAVYAAAALWVVASTAAIASAALVIKFDAPFDDESDPKYKGRVIVGMAEGVVDLILAALLIWLGVLYSRARRSIPAETASTRTRDSLSAFATRNLRALVQVSLLDAWVSLLDGWVKIQGPWDRRTRLDKPVFCLLLAVGLMIAINVFYNSYYPPTLSYSFHTYFFYTVILTYPFLFIFHRWRTAGAIPGLLARGLAFFIFSLLALLWAFFSASFIAVAFYGMFCDPGRRDPHPLPCPRGGQWLSFVMGVLGFLLAFALGSCGVAAWKSGASIQLEVDMEASRDEAPVLAPQEAPASGRIYLARAFKHSLVFTPLTVVPVISSFINVNIFNIWRAPEDFCDPTHPCELPSVLFLMSALGLVPTLLILDHFLAVSPTFGDKSIAQEGVPSSSTIQTESIGTGIEAEAGLHSGPPPPSSVSQQYARSILRVLYLASYLSATLWALASASTTAFAALIIKHDGPFDPHKGEPRYRYQVYTRLAEAVFDLMLVFYAIWQAKLYSRALQFIPPDPSSEPLTSTLRAFGWTIVTTTALEAWTSARALVPRIRYGMIRIWTRRAGTDRTVLCLLASLGLTITSLMLSFSYYPRSCLVFTIVMIYPLLSTFHSHRIAGIISGPIFRGVSCFILSLLALAWVLLSALLVVVAVYGMFCDPWRQSPHSLPCLTRGRVLSFAMGIFGLLLAFSLGFSAFITWKSKVGVQLPPDSEEAGETNRDD